MFLEPFVGRFEDLHVKRNLTRPVMIKKRGRPKKTEAKKEEPEPAPESEAESDQAQEAPKEPPKEETASAPPVEAPVAPRWAVVQP